MGSPDRSRDWVVWCLFALSGLAGIMFEVLWARIFTSILGSTVQSVSAVVAAFMLGIALGTFLLGRLIDHRRNFLLVYGAVEALVGLSALTAMQLFVRFDDAYPALFARLSPEAARWVVFLIAFAFILVPAALIGGTLPALLRHFVGPNAPLKARLGELYACNTAGAALGALAVVALIRHLGYQNCYHLAVFLNLAIGVTALALGWRTRPTTEQSPAHPTPGPAELEPAAPAWEARVVVPAFAVSGFCALGYQLVWFRLLEYQFLGTLVSFSVILATYLFGLSLGSLVFGRRVAPEGGEIQQFVRLQALVGLLALLMLPVLSVVAPSKDIGLTRFVTLVMVLAITFVLGGTFPVVGMIARGPVRLLGHRIGSAYSANTAGAVLGTLVTGFVLIPWLGTEGAYLLLGATSLLVALTTAALLVRPLRGAGLAVACAAALAVAVVGPTGGWLGRYVASFNPGAVLAVRENSLHTLMVTESEDGVRALSGGPFTSGSTSPARRETQRLQGHLPMLVHPNPQRVLEIGYGVGEIARTMNLYKPERLDLVEIDPDMVPVAEEYLGALNEQVSQRPNVHLHFRDGRQHLKMTPETYDVIMTDSMILVSEASLRLYTLEHFRQGRKHLRPGGIMALWVPMNIGVGPSRVVLNTFLEVFPQSLLWMPMGSNNFEAFVIGFRDEVRLDVAALLERHARVAREDLALFEMGDPALFLASFRAGPGRLRGLVEPETRVHRDTHPVIDFILGEGADRTVSFVEQILEHDTDLAFSLPGAGGLKSAERARLQKQVDRIVKADRAFYATFQRYWECFLEDRTQERAGSGRPSKVLAERESLSKGLEQALTLFPRHPGARTFLAELDVPAAEAVLETDPARARRLLERAVGWKAGHSRANAALARLSLADGDTRRARAYAEQALRLSPYCRPATEVLAQCREAEGQRRQAKK